MSQRQGPHIKVRGHSQQSHTQRIYKAKKPQEEETLKISKSDLQSRRKQKLLEERNKLIEQLEKLAEEKKSRPVALDEAFSFVINERNELEKIPDLSPYWIKQYDFIPFFPEDNEKDEVVEFLQDDLRDLLRRDYHKFWSQVIYDKSFEKFLDTYLRFVQRCYDVTDLSLSVGPKQRELMTLVFRVLLRMSTWKESATDFMNKEFFSNLILKNNVFNVPRLFDIAVVFGPFHSSLVHKMFSDLFTVQPKYYDELAQCVPIVLRVLKEIKQKLFSLLTSSPSHISLFELSSYLLDITSTICAFLKVFPESASVFMKFPFIEKIAYYYETLLPHFQSLTMNTSLSAILKSIKRAMLQIVHILMTTSFLRRIDNTQIDFTERERIGEQMYTLLMTLPHISQTEDENDKKENSVNVTSVKSYSSHVGKFVKDFNRAYDLVATISTLKEKTTIDHTKIANLLQYYSLTSEKALTTTKSPLWSKEMKETPKIDFSLFNDPKVQSKIKQLKELFPEYGDGFIFVCLSVLDMNHEQLVNRILEKTLPAPLTQLNPSLSISDAKSIFMQVTKGASEDERYSAAPPTTVKETTNSSSLLVTESSNRTNATRREVDVFASNRKKVSKNLDIKQGAEDWEVVLDDKSWMKDKAVLTRMMEALYEDEPDDSLDEFTVLPIGGDNTVDETTQIVTKENDDDNDSLKMGERNLVNAADTNIIMNPNRADDDEDENDVEHESGMVSTPDSSSEMEKNSDRKTTSNNDDSLRLDKEEFQERERIQTRQNNYRGGHTQRFTTTRAHRYKTHNRKEKALRKRGNFF